MRVAYAVLSGKRDTLGCGDLAGEGALILGGQAAVLADALGDTVLVEPVAAASA